MCARPRPLGTAAARGTIETTMSADRNQHLPAAASHDLDGAPGSVGAGYRTRTDDLLVKSLPR